MNLSDYTWHALFCPPGQELAVGHKLAPLGHPFVVPTEKAWRDRPGTKLTRESSVAVFPRYVFTGFADAPNWELLRERVPALQGYMSFGQGPAVIKSSDMEWLMELRDRLAGKAKPIPFEQAIKAGDQVRIARGPLASTVITVDKVVSKEIHPFHHMLGGMVLVKIGLADVEPA